MIFSKSALEVVFTSWQDKCRDYSRQKGLKGRINTGNSARVCPPHHTIEKGRPIVLILTALYAYTKTKRGLIRDIIDNLR